MRTFLLAMVMFGVAMADEVPQSTSAVSAGSTDGRAAFVPWSGSWWPMATGQLGIGWNGTATYTYDSAQAKYVFNSTVAVNNQSPLAKYDRYVGADPATGAASRELTEDGSWRHHVYGATKARYDAQHVDYSWWGHCNGWSAAAALETEPFAPVEKNGIKFEVADLKGILTESHFGCVSSFTGSRYRAPEAAEKTSYDRAKVLLAALSATPPAATEYKTWYEAAYHTTRSTVGVPSDYRGSLESFIGDYDSQYTAAYDDIRPDVFHQILVKVIGQTHGVVVFDIVAGEAVWNYPAYAYHATLVDRGTRVIGGYTRRVFEATTTVSYSDDGVAVNHLGVKGFTRTYTYELYTTAAGYLRGGKWIGASVDEHPDFAWYPKYNPTTADFSENNKLVYGRIQEILPVKHLGSDGKPFEVKANGTGSQARRAGRNSVTWSNPLASGASVRLTVSATLTGVAQVRWYEQRVTVSSGAARASRDALIQLGTGTDLTVRLNPGKRMIVGYAYDAQGRLLAMDEITVNVQ